MWNGMKSGFTEQVKTGFISVIRTSDRIRRCVVFIGICFYRMVEDVYGECGYSGEKKSETAEQMLPKRYWKYMPEMFTNPGR